MKNVSLRAALLGASLILVGASGVATAPAQAADNGAHSTIASAKHKCTKTSSGSCIAGGQFCPQASFNKSGWDAAGRRYVCKGDHTHPHWMKP